MQNTFVTITAEWAMVIITAIYVLATILIFLANKKSVRVAQEQVEEMRREFDENNRPRVEVELDLKQRVMYALRFTNRGAKTAYNVKINLNSDFLDSTKGLYGADQLADQVGRDCIIGIGQEYELFLFDVKQKKNDTLLPVSGSIHYEADGKEYNDSFSIDIRNYMTFFSCETENEKLLELIDKQNAEISRLNETISVLANRIDSRQSSN